MKTSDEFFEELDISGEEVTKKLINLINDYGDVDLACESQYENQLSIRTHSGRLFLINVVDTGDIDEQVLDDYIKNEVDNEDI